MENSKYDFYKKAFKGKGGSNEVVAVSEAPVSSASAVTSEAPTPVPATEVPATNKTKVDFKFTSLGNLDQTLPKKAKINIDSMFIKSILGGN